MASTTAQTLPTRILAGVQVVDTPIVKSSIDYARANLDDVIFNHVMRSWLWGCLMISKNPALKDTIDLEVHAVSNILHDLGWSVTGPFISADKRFEVDGANAARDFIAKETQGWDARRIQLVWDSIALHTTPSIANFKEAEVAMTSQCIFIDFVGADATGGLVTHEEWDAVRKEFSRAGFLEGAKEAMCHLCKTKPESTYDNFVGGFGEEFVEGYSVKGRRFVDFVGSLPSE